MLSKIVLRANEIVYKPLRKWVRKADRKVDHYVFDVGIVREQPITREISLQPESEAELPFSKTFSTHEYDRNESSHFNEEIVIPDSYNDNNDLFIRDNGDNDPVVDTLTDDDDAQSVHTVSSKFTDLSLGVPRARDKGRVQMVAPSASAPPLAAAPVSPSLLPLIPVAVSSSTSTSTSALALTEIQRQGSIHRKRAVSGSASTSSSKRAISQRHKVALEASREDGYLTRSKSQQQ